MWTLEPKARENGDRGDGLAASMVGEVDIRATKERVLAATLLVTTASA